VTPRSSTTSTYPQVLHHYFVAASTDHLVEYTAVLHVASDTYLVRASVLRKGGIVGEQVEIALIDRVKTGHQVMSLLKWPFDGAAVLYHRVWPATELEVVWVANLLLLWNTLDVTLWPRNV
jgi:hypothetical protein